MEPIREHFPEIMVALLLSSMGCGLLLVAWMFHSTRPGTALYPTWRHALMGRAPGRSGRTGWLVYNMRRDRLETVVVCEKRKKALFCPGRKRSGQWRNL